MRIVRAHDYLLSVCINRLITTLSGYVAVFLATNEGWSVLCYACDNGNAEVVKALLAAGASLNHRTCVTVFSASYF